MSSSEPDSGATEFAQLLWDARTTSFVVLSAFVVLVYDAIVTFSDEASEIADTEYLSYLVDGALQLDLVWSARWTRGKILYLLNRYPIIIVTAILLPGTSNDSTGLEISGAWSMLIFILPAQLALIYRTLALWENNRTMSIFCSIVTAVTDAVIVASIILVDRSTQFQDPTAALPNMGCLDKIKSISLPLVIPACAALMLFDTVIFIVTLQKLRILLEPESKGRTAHILFRDGLLFYLVMLASSAANLATYATLPPARRGLTGALIPVLRTVMSVCTNHLHLNLRGTVEQSGLSTIWVSAERRQNRDVECTNASPLSAVRFTHSTHSEDGMPDTYAHAASESSAPGERGAPALQHGVRPWASGFPTPAPIGVELPASQTDPEAEGEGQDVVPVDLGLHAKAEKTPCDSRARVRRLTGTDELDRGQRGTRIRRRTLYGAVRPPPGSVGSGLTDGKKVESSGQ